MSSTPHYEERRGWSSSSVATFSIISLIAVAGLVGFAFTGSFKLLGLGVLAAAAMVFNALVLTRRGLALRVDEAGIRLVPPSLRASAGELIPWSEVRGIVVHKARLRDEFGVVRQFAGIPTEAHTDGGSPKPDSSVVVTGWSLDVVRLTEVVRAYAPDVTIWDELGLGAREAAAASVGRSAATELSAGQAAEQNSQPAAASNRRPALLAVTSVAVLSLIVGIVIAFHNDGADGYEVQSGPVGTPVTPTIPDQIGALTYLMDDPAPLWQYYPEVFPSGPASTYGTIGGSYVAADHSIADIDIDAVYAKGDNGHIGTFTLGPQALASFAASALLEDAKSYPSGSANSVVECGTYAVAPMCIWAAPSMLVFVYYSDVPGTMTDLIALTPRCIAAMED